MSKCFLVALEEELSGLKEINAIPIIYCGVGKINASIGVFNAINLGFDEIINIGSCGSKNHKVGDVLKIGKVYQDIDITPIFDYGDNSKNEKEIIIDDNYSITCFTTDTFYDDSKNKHLSKNYLDSISKYSVFDMELFSIAQVCKQFNIGLSSYKWVSDDGGYESWKKNCKIGFDSFLKVFFNKNID
jgi:adenosylhomocysteine nucleosidase